MYGTTSHSARPSSRLGVVGRTSLLSRRPLLKKKEEEEEEEEEARLPRLRFPGEHSGGVHVVQLLFWMSLTNLSSGWLVLLVTMHLTLYSLGCCLAQDACIMTSMGQKSRCIPRCRFLFRQWHVQGWYCCFVYTSRCVLCVLGRPRCSDHGRYEPEGPFRPLFPAVACTRLVLLVFYTSRCVSSLIGRPMMLGIMAGINQKDIFALFVDPCRDAEVFSHGPDCSSDH